MKLTKKFCVIGICIHQYLLGASCEQPLFSDGDEIRETTDAIRQALPLNMLFVRPLRHVKTKSYPMEYSFSGYIHHNAFGDSRQVFSIAQGDLLFYPLAYKPDIGGADINNKGQFNMLNIETRLRAEARGPRIWGAHSFGVFEGDCWGNISTIIGLMRVRHAFMYFAWKHISILIGQYWHPLFIPECYPDTISFNTGSPIEPFEREPQFRISSHYNDTKISFTAASYAVNEFQGPAGDVNLYARNAIMPDLNLGIETQINSHSVGIVGNMHRIVPRLASYREDLRVHESLMSYGGQVYATCTWNRFVLHAKAIFMQNGQQLDMLGGYAVSCIDLNTDKRCYANLNVGSVWIDMAIKGTCEPGCFIGYTKNLGADTAIDTSLMFTEGPSNIDYVFRISPRLRYFVDPLGVAAELEYTRAAYGTPDYRGRMKNTCAVGNIRLTGALFYCF
jgi:hypothetical protein